LACYDVFVSKQKQKGAIKMRKAKKAIMGLSLSVVVLGVTACGGVSEGQDLQSQDNTYTTQYTNQVTSTLNPDAGEILVGTVYAIDGMNITVIANQHQLTMASSSGMQQQVVSPNSAEDEPQEKTIRLTEHTAIYLNQMRALEGGGQIAENVAATLDELSLQYFVMAMGEWQGNEFVANSLTIMPR
jgi:hypothetical protein